MSEKKFPILGTNKSIDWNLIAPHEKQAMENHCGQTLEQLARRHGLSWYELLCVLLDKPFTEVEYDKEKNYKELCQMALVSEEVKQYRAIGTPEECRAAVEKQKTECEWKLEDLEQNLYATECENRQLIFEGTPEENGYKYCTYCGRKIKAGGADGN